VFPTFENYVDQFAQFAQTIEDGGTLIYYKGDEHLCRIAQQEQGRLELVAYDAIDHRIENGSTTVIYNNHSYELKIFGSHNLQNISAAMAVCQRLGVDGDTFLKSMMTFAGAARRLQILHQSEQSAVYFDFAHSPSKLKATTAAVKEQFPNRKLVACMELHTFSSLNKAFLPQYLHSMQMADEAYVYFSPKVIEHKRLEQFDPQEVADAFQHPNLKVITNSAALFDELKHRNWQNTNLLIMTSGNCDGVDIKSVVKEFSV
jgi:UDP-N-acetylmuramate: L-alanyl-gamma-D-glutamyl-meso-diaminopimelate ligase